MKHWSVKDAQAHFSKFLDTCLKEGPQMVTKHGEEVAVLVPAQDSRRMEASSKPTLKELLLADEPRGELIIPQRGRFKLRPPKAFM